MRINQAGNVRPDVIRQPAPEMLERVLSVCPGSELELPASRRPGPPPHTVWGPVFELHRVWATDPRVRHKAAAGGALTGLGCHLLSSGEVDAVVHVRANAQRPILTDGVVSYTEDEVIAASQSRYGPAAPLTRVMRLLDEGTRFAVIAKPCDISAIRALGRIDDRVEHLVPYLLTMFCGGIHHVGIPKKIIEYHGLAEDDVIRFGYRGDGWPGPTTVESRDGRRFDLSYDETWLTDDKPWRFELQFRCKICPDHIGEQADIAIGDAWLLEDGKPVHREADGINVAVVRTDAGRRLLMSATERGYLTLAPMSFEELNLMHPEQVEWKLSDPARRGAMVVARQPTLSVRHSRTREVVREAGTLRLLRAFFGTLYRIRRGDNREPLVLTFRRRAACGSGVGSSR